MDRKTRNGVSKGFLSLAVIFTLIALGLDLAARHIPRFADRYTTGVYPFIVDKIGGFFGKVSFSVRELLIYLLVLWLLFRILRFFGKIGDWGFFSSLYALISSVLFVASVLFLMYTLNCGINYHRTRFSSEYSFSTEPYSPEDLKLACEYLTDEVKETYRLVDRDRDGVMRKKDNWGFSARKAVRRLRNEYPRLDVAYPLPKRPFIHHILSVPGIRGVYSPFTVEANYNGGMTGYNIPFTMCHELSHLSGFMNEDEANFIAWLACRSSSDPALNYSGALSCWIYCTNRLKKLDPAAYAELRSSLPEEVEKDLAANNAFWARFPEKASEVHDRINDQYLKIQGQEEGILTYNRMVDLVVNLLSDEFAGSN